MKKHLTTLYLFAATMLVATTLTGCGEAVDIDGQAVETGKTEFVFEANADGTRTSMNADRYYYWEPGDKIWVKTGSSSYAMSKQSTITASRQATARFIVDEDLSGSNNYPVVYTGYTGTVGVDTASTVATSVTIAAAQTQSAWNNGQHLAVSGDCGTGTAIKQANGQYKFTLFHQAHYLVLYPYLGSTMTGNYTLQKVEIISDDSSSPITGEYTINPNTTTNALADYPITGTEGNTVTLTCNGGFLLSTDVPNLAVKPITSNYLVAVIHPGTHYFLIKYTVTNASNETFTFYQELDEFEYPYGSVTPLTFELASGAASIKYPYTFREVNAFFRWGRTYDYYGTGTNDYLTTTSTAGSGPASAGFWSSTTATLTEAASRWYFVGGGYYDSSIEWDYLQRDGTTVTRRGGWWLKKRAYIPNFNAAADPTGYYSLSCETGRPDESIRNTQYFFLPALRSTVGTTYWTSLSTTSTTAVTINFNRRSINQVTVSKNNTNPAGYRSWNGPANTPWFQ